MMCARCCIGGRSFRQRSARVRRVRRARSAAHPSSMLTAARAACADCPRRSRSSRRRHRRIARSRLPRSATSTVRADARVRAYRPSDAAPAPPSRIAGRSSVRSSRRPRSGPPRPHTASTARRDRRRSMGRPMRTSEACLAMSPLLSFTARNCGISHRRRNSDGVISTPTAWHVIADDRQAGARDRRVEFEHAVVIGRDFEERGGRTITPCAPQFAA